MQSDLRAEQAMFHDSSELKTRPTDQICSQSPGFSLISFSTSLQISSKLNKILIFLKLSGNHV